MLQGRLRGWGSAQTPSIGDELHHHRLNRAPAAPQAGIARSVCTVIGLTGWRTRRSVIFRSANCGTHGDAGRTKRSSWRNRKERRSLVNCSGDADSTRSAHGRAREARQLERWQTSGKKRRGQNAGCQHRRWEVNMKKVAITLSAVVLGGCGGWSRPNTSEAQFYPCLSG